MLAVLREWHHLRAGSGVCALSAILATWGMLSCSATPNIPSPGDARAMQVHAAMLPRLDSLVNYAETLQKAATAPVLDSAAMVRVRKAFVNTRAAYKRVEWWIEAYLPLAAEQLNGPP